MITVEMRLKADDLADLPALAAYALKRLGDSGCACAGDGSYHIRRTDYRPCCCWPPPELEADAAVAAWRERLESDVL